MPLTYSVGRVNKKRLPGMAFGSRAVPLAPAGATAPVYLAPPTNRRWHFVPRGNVRIRSWLLTRKSSVHGTRFRLTYSLAHLRVGWGWAVPRAHLDGDFPIQIPMRIWGGVLSAGACGACAWSIALCQRRCAGFQIHTRTARRSG